MQAVLVIASLALSSALGAAPPKPLLVVSAPGSPGTSAEAQPTMDQFAAALSAKAGVALSAVYEESEDAAVARLRGKDAAAALVSLPFFLKYERDLALRARLQAVPKGRPDLDRWTLLAKKGRVATPAALDSFTLVSNAGFAPAFVRGPALGGHGPLPSSVHIVQSGNVLSSLRRAAAGEPVAVLVDGTQEAALASLPFASELEAVARSRPLPVGVVATVDRHLADKTWSAVAAALLTLPSDARGAEALDALRTARFVKIDEGALAAAREAYAEAAR